MFKLHPIALMLILTATNSFHVRAEQENSPVKLSKPLDQMLRWLPEDTETLIVLQEPIEISPAQEEEEVENFEKITFFDMAQYWPTVIALELHDQMLRKELLGEKILLAVEGSRSFRYPKGLGMMPYEGCEILQFAPEAHDSLEKAFRLCLDRAPKTIRLCNEQVAFFTEKWERDILTLLVAHPQPDLLLCATNQSYLETVLQRMQQKKNPKNRAFPADLPEWQHVDTKASLWALRHYSRDQAPDDPTSPFDTDTDVEYDPQAIGFVFLYGSKEDKRAKVRYLSKSKEILQIAKRYWERSPETPQEDFKPKFKQIDKYTVEVSADVTETEPASVFVLLALYYLAHGVVI